MVAPTFTDTKSLTHGLDVLELQNFGRNRVKFNDTGAILDFVRLVDGLLIDERFPLESPIESGPIFVNASDFPALLPTDWITSTIRDNTSAVIEFRTAAREDMRGATDWQSLSPDGSNTNVEQIPSTFNGPFSTDQGSMRVLSLDTTRFNIVWGADTFNSFGECIFYTSADVAVQTDFTIAKYLSADVVADRAGVYLEWHVINGLSIPDIGIGESSPPFKKLIRIDEALIPQRIFWDLTDWGDLERNWERIKVLSFKVTDASLGFSISIDNIQLSHINDSSVSSPGASKLPVPVNRFIQYRIVLSTNKAGFTPEVQQVAFDFTHKPAILPSNMLRHQKFFENPLTYPNRNGVETIYPDPPAGPVSTLNTGITYFFEMDEFSDLTRVDSVGSNDLLDRNSNVAFRSPGAEFTGILSPSTVEVLEAADDPALSVSGADAPFTLSCYITLDSVAVAPTGRIVAKVNSIFTGFEYSLIYIPSLNGSLGGFSFRIINSLAAVVAVDHTFVPLVSTEYHLVAYHDPVADEIALIVDDTFKDTTANSDGTLVLSGPLHVGNSEVVSGLTEPVKGVVRKLSKWDKVLSDSEITELFNVGTPLSHPF